MGLRDWIAKRKYGGQTGLNEMGNNAKMTGIITGPFFVGWIFIQLFVPYEYVELGIILLLTGWVAYCVLIYAGAKSDANNYRAFPQPVWRFPDGGVRVFNKMLVAPDCYEEICKFKDGGLGIHIEFQERFQYHQRGVPFPYVFKSAFWKIPAKFDDSFSFASGGEFFHKGIAIEHPACESISVYVVAWSMREGSVEPICLINDCSFQYDEMMDNSKKVEKSELKQIQKLEMQVSAGKKREMALLLHSGHLEDTVDATMKEGSKDIKEIVDEVLKAVRTRVHTIMDTEESRLKRIFTWKNIGLAIIVVAFLLFFAKFIMGWI